MKNPLRWIFAKKASGMQPVPSPSSPSSPPSPPSPSASAGAPISALPVLGHPDLTPLQRAALWGRAAEVADLLASGTEFEANAARKTVGDTALILAARLDNAALPVLLQSEKVLVNLRNHRGQSPLIAAVEQGFPSAVEKILAHPGVNPNIRDGYGRAALHIAVAAGDERKTRILLAHPRTDTQVPDRKFRTAADIALENKNHVLLALLLAAPQAATPDRFLPEAQETLLHRAARAGDAVTLALMLKVGGVNPNVRDGEGRTPLHLAAAANKPDAVAALLAHPAANPNAVDARGYTPLHRAVIGFARNGAAALLQDRRTDPYELTDSGYHAGTLYGHDNRMAALLSANGRYRAGDDARLRLLSAVVQGREALVKTLLARPEFARTLEKDRGQAVLRAAVEKKHTRILQVLQDHLAANDQSLQARVKRKIQGPQPRR